MERFSVPFEDFELAGDLVAKKAEKPSTIFLHGAGQSNRGRWQHLREALFVRGIGSYAFDFIGHGETGGELTASSLEWRTNQVLQVVKTLNISPPLTLIGSSMGAYTALKVSQKISVKTFVFLVPAMYSRDVYNINFGPQFSIIRKSGSWQNSDAWDILAQFSGQLLIIGAEKDETVPRELTQKLYDSASRATKRELYFVPNSSHALGQFMRENPAEKEKVASLIARFCA